MSINTGGCIGDPNYVELFIADGSVGRCGSAIGNQSIHMKGNYCDCEPKCRSLGMWYKNATGSSTAGLVGNVISMGSVKSGKMSDKEYELSSLRWDYKHDDSDIVHYRFKKEGKEKEREMVEEDKTVKMGKFGKAEVSKMAHYFQSVEDTMKPFRNFRKIVGDRSLWHVKQGGTVCLMAHIDTVKTPTIPRHDNGTIWAKGLDDRLGVYMAIRLYSERDDVDVIITDDEERGMSTADMLTKEDLSQYNSIIELDRAGNDFVHYGCADTDLINAYSVYADEGIGAFSDIDYITDHARECGCINIGIGYKNAHGDNSYVKVKDLAESWKNINSFLDVYHNIKFAKADKSKYGYGFSDCTTWGHTTDIKNYQNYQETDYYTYCDYCGYSFDNKELTSMGDSLVCCERCFDYMMRSNGNLVGTVLEDLDDGIQPTCSECTLELMEYEKEKGICEYCEARRIKKFVGHFNG